MFEKAKGLGQKGEVMFLWLGFGIIALLVICGIVAMGNGGKVGYTMKDTHKAVFDVANEVYKGISGQDYLDCEYKFSTDTLGNVYVNMRVLNTGVDGEDYSKIYRELDEGRNKYETALAKKNMVLVSYVVVDKDGASEDEYKIVFDDLYKNDKVVFSSKGQQ